VPFVTQKNEKLADEESVLTFLAREVQRGLDADENEFIAVSATDVMRRNKRKPRK
jgi:hypothetical protein